MRLDFNIVIDEIARTAEKYPEATRAETEAVMEIIMARMEAEVVERTPAGVGGGGGLRGSIHGEVIPSGWIVTGAVGTPLAYGEVVEYGRKPGKFPPVKPIELWVRRKLGVGPDESPAVARMIAWKIKHKGTEGAHMFEEAWDDNLDWIHGQLRTVPERVERSMA